MVDDVTDFWSIAMRKVSMVSIFYLADLGGFRLIGKEVSWWQAAIVGLGVLILYSIADGEQLFPSRRRS